MDDKRFDGLVKGLAAGKSRRSVLKGIFGLGGAALVGGTLLENDADAARRPTPTPKPVKCPGRQTWNGTACVCPPDAPQMCGSDCCNPTGWGAGRSECCDGACCFGSCIDGEMCCASGELCGGECCADGWACCDGVCFDPSLSACCGGALIPNTTLCCNEIPVPGGQCCDAADCDFGSACCDHVCNDRGYCGNCKPNGIMCASNPECCSGWCGSGTCTSQPNPCLGVGASCFFSNECCDGLWCDGNRCSEY